MFQKSEPSIASEIIFSSDLEEPDDLTCFHKQINFGQLNHQTKKSLNSGFVLKNSDHPPLEALLGSSSKAKSRKPVDRDLMRQGLAQIKSLSLDQKNLTFFNSNQDFDVHSLKRLSSLNLRFNFLKKLDGITRIRSLVHLDLSNNFLTK